MMESDLQCVDPRQQWRAFDTISYASYPSLTAILPIHNSQLNSSYVKFMLLTDKINSTSTIWVSNDPPSSMDFYPLFIGEFNFTDHGVHTFSSTIYDSNIFVTMDIALYVSSFSYDRKNMFHDLANDGVPSTWVASDIRIIRPDDNKGCDIDDRYVFSLNIITFIRPWSLRRLLESLLKADYGGCSVDINIRIDSVIGSKYDNAEDLQERMSMLALQEETISVAYDFDWPFGNKQYVASIQLLRTITLRRVFVYSHNIGLMQQWHLAFEPKHEYDIGFILEDDLEVNRSTYWKIKLFRCLHCSSCGH